MIVTTKNKGTNFFIKIDLSDATHKGNQNNNIINNLKKKIGKCEKELRSEKSKNQTIVEKYKKQIETLNNKKK
ncbi:hypothetical protein U3516DRAFT_765336 [Neocallimastix sp. 'constans']